MRRGRSRINNHLPATLYILGRKIISDLIKKKKKKKKMNEDRPYKREEKAA